jgi:hypothetical protein
MKINPKREGYRWLLLWLGVMVWGVLSIPLAFYALTLVGKLIFPISSIVLTIF